jgi:hypothetical protein
MIDFQGFPKIPRLSREVVITEKIDGTCGVIAIGDDGDMYVGSRNRWITPEDDNFGFAKWAFEHAKELHEGLGPGRHFGEWWGSGIQRGYGLPKGEKRFSLFNTSKWSDDSVRPSCCHVVPVIISAGFNSATVDYALEKLFKEGSLASPGFMRPEGIIIYHTAGNLYFKKTIEKDEKHKSEL